MDQWALIFTLHQMLVVMFQTDPKPRTIVILDKNQLAMTDAAGSANCLPLTSRRRTVTGWWLRFRV
jgi:hypothetical protein